MSGIDVGTDVVMKSLMGTRGAAPTSAWGCGRTSAWGCGRAGDEWTMNMRDTREHSDQGDIVTIRGMVRG